MGETVVSFPARHGQEGYSSLKDSQQGQSISEIALSTGWEELDQIWKLYAGQFNVITGVAGHGKSTFLLNVVCNVAHDSGMRTFLYVPENERFIRDKLERIWGVRRGFEYFASDQCYVQSAIPARYDTPPQTLEWVLDQAVIAIQKDQVDNLVIDPWNELERARPKDMLMSDYIGQCLMYLKQFCRAYGVTVNMVAHPTKAGVEQGKTPTLADIEGSMNWYNKCDNGLIVVRDPKQPACKVISAKAREEGSGRRGECHFTVDAYSGQFFPQENGVLL